MSSRVRNILRLVEEVFKIILFIAIVGGLIICMLEYHNQQDRKLHKIKKENNGR
jgi:hypothetical protein